MRYALVMKTSNLATRWCVSVCAIATLVGCTVPDLEDAMIEKLTCAELVRPSTLHRLQEVLRNPNADDIAALLLNPADLAGLIAQGGPQLEGAVVVAQNLRLLVDSGAGADLLAHGWDGVQCGERQVVACTAGRVTSTVGCTAGLPTDIVLAFDSCVLQGFKQDGALQLARDLDNDVASFDVGIVNNEIQVLQGAGLLDLGHADAFTVALTDGFSVVDHGGMAGGLSCGAENRLSEAGFDLADDTATVTLALTHDTRDEHLAFATTSPVVFDGHCGCPLPGAAIVMDVPRPLGREGETARASISWSESDDDNACARANVTLSDWPTDCLVGGDCAKAATASAMTKLLSAFCYVQ